MKNYSRIERYLFDFFSNRFDDFDSFYKSVHQARQTEIYLLKSGTLLMDLIISIHGNIEEKFYSENLIPHKFATPEALLASLDSFKHYLKNKQYLLEINTNGENTSYIINDLQRIINEIIQAVDYVKQMYDNENDIVPYQELRYSLIVRDILTFVKMLKSIYASIPYAIFKSKEGFYHSNTHIILKILGFDIISEDCTNTGRIDAVIKLSDTIYILEFKFSEAEDLSSDALNQIKDKDYARKFMYERKDIIALGISFSEGERNINGFKSETINK